jgi:hypothetical protein
MSCSQLPFKDCTATQLYTELLYNVTAGGQPLKEAVGSLARRQNLQLDKVIGPGYDDIRVVHG